MKRGDDALITGDELRRFREQGYVRLGRLLDDRDLDALRTRIDRIMLGAADAPYDRMLMQLDPSTDPPEHLQGQTKGHKGATLAYRKVQDLELDPLFHAYLTRPLFADLCRRIYGPGTPVACYRAMFLNKPAGGGSDLIWHQDRWTELDRDPLITVWTALDPASKANGCVEIVPRSHGRLRNPVSSSGFLSDEQREELDRQIAAGAAGVSTIHLEMEAGEAVLLHNWTLHRSGTNRTDLPRRAFSVCYMDGATRSTGGGAHRLVFDGDGRAVAPA